MGFVEGTKLGRYEIRSLIGAGGMGEVYLARDPKIGREVAIKVLPETLADDKERLARFEQEAQAAGSLNHPNILAIYDVQADGAAPYVVSELLEGETLRESIGGTPLPVRKALGYGLQIAHGLAAAHEKGIIHRDLKPENLFVTADGRIKILDFGLAKLTESGRNGTVSTDLPTKKVNTDAGAVMGTVGYMSPEQLRGRPVDQRTDIFSFGSVLYEMLSGQKAFQKDSTADTISAILREDPPELSETNKSVDHGLERIVHRCLEKNREERFHSASDLAFALGALTGVADTGKTRAVSAYSGETDTRSLRGNKMPWLGWAAAALFLVSTIALAALYFRRTEPPVAPIRFNLMSPEKTTFGDSLALSPDGNRLALVVVSAAGEPDLWIRALGSLDAQKLPGTEGAAAPFWSPDGRYIGFFAANKLKKISVDGGTVQTLADAGVDPRGGSWAVDGTIIYSPEPAQPIFKIASTGGAPVQLTQLDPGREETSHRWPWFLPDGRHYLYFSRGTNKELEGVFVGSLDSSDRKQLFNSRLQAIYAPGVNDTSRGNLVFVRDGTLLAQAFDANKIELIGDPITIAQNVRSFPTEVGPTASSMVSASANGHLVYRTGGQAVTQLSWIDRAGGKASDPLVAPANYHEPMISPDGKRVVVSRQDESNQDLWLLELSRNLMTRFTFEQASEASAVWYPDGSRIIYASNGGGKYCLFQKAANGVGPEEQIWCGTGNAYPDGVTSDGKYLLYEEDVGSKNKFDIFVLPLEGERTPKPIVQSQFSETHAQFSPDGKWISYTSDESGRAEVYVTGFQSGGKWQVSTDGGDEAMWNPRGNEVFYIRLDRTLVSVPYSARNSFEPGPPVSLFQANVPQTGLTDERNHYLVSPDGQRFLLNNLIESGKSIPLTLVLNWEADLKR